MYRLPVAEDGSTPRLVRMLTRLGLLTSGKGARINNGQEGKRAAHALSQSTGFDNSGNFRRKATSHRTPSRMKMNKPRGTNGAGRRMVPSQC